MKNFLIYLPMAILFLVLSPQSVVEAQAGVSLSVSPTSQTAGTTGTANVAINVANLPTANAIQFQITYNPTYLSIASSGDVTAGTFFPTSTKSTDLSQDASGIAIIGIAANDSDGHSGNGTVANIKFTTKAISGTANLTLSNSFYDDPSWNQVNITTFTNGSITVGTVTPTATPTVPAPTATPTVTPMPSATPSPTVTPMPSATPSPTGVPTDANLTISFRLQGVTEPTGANQTITFKFKDFNTQTNILATKTASLDADANGVFSTTLTNLPRADVKVCIKGQSHLQRCFPRSNETQTAIHLASGANTLNRSTVSADVLLVGDVTDIVNSATVPNVITIEDVAAISSKYSGSFSVPVPGYPATDINEDVNHDGRITIDDLALATMNYSNFNLPGDN